MSAPVSACHEAARIYAGRGWRVFPSHAFDASGNCTCGRSHVDADGNLDESRGKHPVISNWQNLATTDLEQIDEWWLSYPWANVSIATGEETGLFVIDVDTRKGGGLSVDEYDMRTPWGLPQTMKVITGSGGYHLFYTYPDGRFKVGNATNWLDGVDIRGDGGQVIAPPSLHHSGNHYAWAELWAEGPQPCPDEVVDSIGHIPSRRRGAPSQSLRERMPSLTEILLGVPAGQRNDTLFREACRLRRMLKDEWPAIKVLIGEAARNCNPPVPAEEVDQILRSAAQQDHTEDLQPIWLGITENRPSIPDPNKAPAKSPEAIAGAEPPDVEEVDGLLPLTDDGNARRFVARYGGDFVWTAAGWYVWDQLRWRRDDLLAHQDRARLTARHISSEGLELADNDDQKQVLKWARLSQMAPRIGAMTQLARSALAREIEAFDADDWLLNCRNAVVDLRTGETFPHDRDLLMTRVVGTDYDPSARCPQWDEFMDLIIPDPDVRLYVQKAVGYSLTGVTDEKALFICYGESNAGKSVFIEALRKAVFGTYAMTAPKSVIMTDVQEHKTELAGLAGARFVTLGEEVEKRDRLRTGVLKALTGGDEMTARFMRQDFFVFRPRLKFWIATNHKPGITDFGTAMKTRLKLIPFTVVIPPERRRDRDEVLADFQGEASGILNWALAGLHAWRQTRMLTPTVMEAGVAEWFDEEDLYRQYVEERVVRGDGWISVNDLYRDYQLWMEGRGEGRLVQSQRVFSREMTSHQLTKLTINNTRGWQASLQSELPAWAKT